MEKYRSHLIIAKIHTSGFPKKDLFDSVKEFLSKCEPYEEVRKGEHENYFWLFGDLDFLYESKDKIIYGKLGKRKESEQRTKYLEEPRKFVKEKTIEPKVDSVSRFIISSASNILIYEEKPSKISRNQFEEVFTRMYRDYFNDFSTVRIDPTLRTEEVFHWIREQEKILSINFTLSPSNPSDRAEFKVIDKLLQEAKTEEANLALRNLREGLNTKSILFEQGVHLSGAGYGSYSITAENHGETSVLVSKDNINREVIETETDEEDTIKKTILNKLRSLKGRKRQQ